MMRENRLIGLTQAALRRQQKAAGATPKIGGTSIQTQAVAEDPTVRRGTNVAGVNVDPTELRINPRAARAIVEDQNATHREAVASNQEAAGFTEGAETARSIQPKSTDPGVASTTEIRQTALPPTTGAKMQKTTAGGNIDQAALDRLVKSGLTPAQAMQQILRNRPSVRETASNTGLGVEFDPETGRVIPGTYGNTVVGNTTPTAREEAAMKAKRDAELEGIVGYTKSTYVDENGGTHEIYTPDPGATANARNERINANAKIDEANATKQKVAADEEAANAPAPAPEAFLDGLTESERGSAETMFSPLFDAINAQFKIAGKQLKEGESALDQIDAVTTKYVEEQKGMVKMLADKYDQLFKQQMNNQLDSAARTADAQRRITDLQQRRTESEFNRAIRDQIVSNEENKKNQLLGLGVSGGWKSSRQTADVINALAKGDRVLADLRTDAAFANESYSNKLLDIESNYHSNVVGAYEQYQAVSLGLFDKTMQEARALDNTVFSTTVDKIKGKVQLKEKYLEAIGNYASDYAKTVVEQTKYANDTAIELKKIAADDRKTLMSDTFKYIDMYGTQNKTELLRREQALGLPVGSLSNQKTLEEIKKYGSASGGKYNPQQIADWLDATYQTYLDAGATPAEAQDRALQSWATFNGTSASNRETLSAGEIYLNYKYGSENGHASTLRRQTPYEVGDESDFLEF